MPNQINDLKNPFPVCGWSFHSHDCVLGVVGVIFILMKYTLSIFDFMDCAFGVSSKKRLPNPRPQRLSPMFSSRIFIALDFYI